MANQLLLAINLPDPERYGVAVIEDEKVVEIQEKPNDPKSDVAIVGLYFYTNDVISKAKQLKPSERGELEITDLNNLYIKDNLMEVSLMEEGFTWLDTGTFDSLHKASTFVKLLQKTSNYRLGLIDEIAFLNNFISKEQLKKNLLNLSYDFQKYLSDKYL